MFESGQFSILAKDAIVKVRKGTDVEQERAHPQSGLLTY
jgi:hypothetical protein